MGPKTPAANSLHQMKYRSPGEDFREAANRWAVGLKDDDDHYHVLREIFLLMRYLPAGRVQSAIGAGRQTTAFNCFVSGTIADSFVDGPGSIMARAHEAAATMRMGGGIGYDFSTLRPRGALIRKLQSISSGPVNFMRIFNEICLCTSSSGHRRGAQMGVLRIDHPDIEEFILAKQNQDQLTGFNVSVAVTDEFMEAALAEKEFDLRFNGEVYKTVDAAALWERLMRSTWDFAEPGVLFIDQINRMNNLYYCETIAATNPCFSADTMVWTAHGPKTFGELAAAGESVPVLTQLVDGSLAYRKMNHPRKTQHDARLVKVVVRGSGKKNGSVSVVRCTQDHRFFLKDGRVVEAQNLQPGDRISSAYRHKANSSGYVKINGVMEQNIAAEFQHGRRLEINETAHHIDENKTNNAPENMEIMTKIAHRQYHMRGPRNPVVGRPVSNHFTGQHYVGELNGHYRSDITDEQLRDMRESGLSFAAIAKQLECSKYMVMNRLGWKRPDNHRVVRVEVLDEREDVYCGTVEETGRFFVWCSDNEGVLVSNCGEQPLPPNGACLLGSFNLPAYLVGEATHYSFDSDQLIADIEPIVRAMDNVTDRTRYPLAEQRAEAVSKRRMGLGITGLANCAEALGLPYGGQDFLNFEEMVLSLIRDHAYLASSNVAKKKGSFPLYDWERFSRGQFFKTLPTHVQDHIQKNGLRNSHLTSIAPTGTISMCADNVSSSIEPVFAYSAQRPINTPDGQRIETIEDYGVQFLGVRGRLADEITAVEHVKVLCTAQEYVDSSVSKTVNMDGEIMEWGDFKDLYKTAWEAGAKGCTTFNKSGLRAALLTSTTDDASVCKIDPETGRKECS